MFFEDVVLPVQEPVVPDISFTVGLVNGTLSSLNFVGSGSLK